MYFVRPRIGYGRCVLWLLALALAIAHVSVADAGQERYDYDALGRLMRVIDEQGRVTQYVYDAAGNILQVITDASVQPPAVTSIDVTSMRRGETRQVTLTGSGLAGAEISVSDPGLDITGVHITASRVNFSLAAALTVTLGAQPIRLTNAAGTATTSITVNPVLPTVFVDPTPLAIPPDNVARQITLRLSGADNIAHVLALSMSNVKASISPASVTIPAGQTQTNATIRGISAGQSTLTLTSATLGTTLFPVFVTGEFAGISTSVAPPLGVVLQSSAPANQTTITPVASKLLGIVVGNFIRGLAPANFTVGTGPTTLTVSGAGLQSAQSVAIVPPTGVTLGAITLAPDGTSLSVPLTVASNAPISQRKVVVSGPSGSFLLAAPDIDRINIVRTPPQILSIDPIFSTKGALVTLTIRGSNLHEAQSVALSPPTGLTVGASPVTSTDGSTLTAIVSVGANAPAGARTVIVTTPGGSSDATPTAANSFSVVNQAVQTVTPITSSLLGVVLQDASPPVAAPATLFTPVLGITLGSVVTSISPTVGVIGQTATLTLQGNELQSVSSIQMVPNTGLTLGAVSTAPDGRSVTVPVTIDVSAAQTLRTLRVFSGATRVPFASSDAALFRVSAPAPVFDSITPITLQLGLAATTLTIRGQNLQNASAVSVVLPDNVSISNPPSVSTDGTQLSVNISAAANAATGPRAVVVTTPGGPSASALTPQNTLTLTGTAGTSVTPVTAPSVGVVLQGNAPPPTIDIGPVIAPAVGVVLQDANPPPATTQTVFTTATVGVVVGPVARSVAPTGFAPNTSGILIIQGFALNGTTAVTVNPATGVTLGALSVAPDGTQVSVPIAIAIGAPATIREVRLQTAGGRIPFADPSASRVSIGAGVPQFDSITPILSAQGTSFTMTIRGSNFIGATAVTATPPDGIAISNSFTVNAAGTQLDVQMSVAPNAPVGSRVIQVLVPGAASSATATPANTFGVITP